MPNFSGRVLQGADSGHNAGITIEAGLPNITSPARSYGSSNKGTEFNGAIFYAGYDASNTMAITSGTGAYLPYMQFDASRSSSIYGNSTTVQPPAIAINLCIKY